MSRDKHNVWMPWNERVAALRQLPPVLNIVWKAGPTVVFLGVLFRIIAALLPIGLLAISKLIIDNIVGVISQHQPISPVLWWLVGAEFALAAFGSMLTRVVDYLDSLLADKYTRYVSIEVMRHAAGLDLAAYEDPVFYDRLERARVQATDRLGMIQSLGRLLQQIVTTLSLSISIVYFSPWLLLAANRRSRTRVSWRESLCISGVRQEFPPDPRSSPPRLPTNSWEAAKKRQRN